MHCYSVGLQALENVSGGCINGLSDRSKAPLATNGGTVIGLQGRLSPDKKKQVRRL